MHPAQKPITKKKKKQEFIIEDRQLRFLKKVGVISSVYPDKFNKLTRGQKSYFTKLLKDPLILRVLKDPQRYVSYKCQTKDFVNLLIESGFGGYIKSGVLFVHCGVDDRVYVDEKKGSIKVREQYGKKTKRVLTYKLGSRNDFIFDEVEGYESDDDLRPLEPGESVGRNMPANPGFNRWGIYNARYTYEELLEEINRYLAVEDPEEYWCLVYEYSNYSRNRREEVAAEKAGKVKALRMKRNLFARTHKHKD